MKNGEKETFKSILRIAECEKKYFPKALKARVEKEIRNKRDSKNLEQSDSGKNSLDTIFLD